MGDGGGEELGVWGSLNFESRPWSDEVRFQRRSGVFLQRTETVGKVWEVYSVVGVDGECVDGVEGLIRRCRPETERRPKGDGPYRGRKRDGHRYGKENTRLYKRV